MNFTCEGTIVGFTVALRNQRTGTELQRPMIQIWRPEESNGTAQCSTGVYHKEGVAIVMDEALCVDGLVEDANRTNIFNCRLNESVQVKVQPGDFVGLELPKGGVQLLFAKVVKGPTNYVFAPTHTSATVNISDSISVNQDLPQITIEVHSGERYDPGSILLSSIFPSLFPL